MPLVLAVKWNPFCAAQISRSYIFLCYIYLLKSITQSFVGILNCFSDSCEMHILNIYKMRYNYRWFARSKLCTFSAITALHANMLTICCVRMELRLRASDTCSSKSFGFDERCIRLALCVNVSWRVRSFISALKRRHDLCLIAGNLRVAGSHHKAISFQCVSNDVNLSDHRLQLLIIANKNHSNIWQWHKRIKGGNEYLDISCLAFVPICSFHYVYFILLLLIEHYGGVCAPISHKNKLNWLNFLFSCMK